MAVVVVGATGAVSWGRSIISIRAMGALSVIQSWENLRFNAATMAEYLKIAERFLRDPERTLPAECAMWIDS